MLTRIKFFSYLNHVTIWFRLGNTVFVQIKSDKVCFQSGHSLNRDPGIGVGWKEDLEWRYLQPQNRCE